MEFLADPYTFILNWLQSLLVGWGMPAEWASFVLILVGAVITPILGMVFTIFLIWLERKLLGRFQDRIGPNRVGPFGLIQPFADMIKIFTKEIITPAGADWLPYNLGPILCMAGVLLLWAVIPFSVTMFGVDLSVGILYLIAVGGLGELGFILSGWGSNNKFSLLAAFRAVAMLLSYEIPMVISLLIPVMLSGSMSMNEIARAQTPWYILMSPLAGLIFFITLIAEMGRSPFDLLEADSELVAGINLEYSGLKFGMFYVADFCHAFTISLIFSTIFLGGWRGPGAEQYPILGFIYLCIKSWIVYFVGIWIRGSLPRFRIDQMMNISWKLLTPLSLAVLVCTALADKLVPAGQPVIRVAVLLIVNIVILLITNQILKWMEKKTPRAEFKVRPVARYQKPVVDQSVAQTDNGVQP